MLAGVGDPAREGRTKGEEGRGKEEERRCSMISAGNGNLENIKLVVFGMQDPVGSVS